MADTDTGGAVDADIGETATMSAVTKYRLTSKANQPEDIAFRFLDLPMEVRDMIYDYVWIGSAITKQRLEYKVYTVLYRASFWDPGQGRRISSRIPSWLLTNKQIMREGLAQLQRESAWHIDEASEIMIPRSNFFANSKIDTPHLLPSDVLYMETSYKHGPVFVWRPEENAHVFQDRSARLSSFLTIYPEATQIQTFILQLHDCSDYEYVWDHQLRRRVGVYCMHHNTDEMSFDLSLLKQLTSCSQLTKFCIQHTSIAGDYGFYEDPAISTSRWTMVKLHLQGLADAAARIGKFLLEGGQETVTNLHHYWDEVEDARKKDEYVRKVFWRYTIERLYTAVIPKSMKPNNVQCFVGRAAESETRG